MSASSIARTGVLLLNLGTPASPAPADVGRYLREFLMDPLVIDIAAPLRWLLVNVLVVPRRSKTSGEAYEKVWTKRGSPLLFHLLDLHEKVERRLGADYVVRPAMRYGTPSILSQLAELQKQNVDRLVILPLYPQYSLAATESSVLEVKRALQEVGWNIAPEIIPAFFDRPEFIESFRQVIERELAKRPYDYLLFSFHGLPVRQVKRTDRSPGKTHCFATPACCDQMTDANRDCYRAQCFQTARSLGGVLGLPPERYGVSFQSRLGRTEWIKPYSDVLYEELPRKGIRRIAVACPAFVADCLETLEEVALRGRETFVQAGGEDLFLVPSLNSDDTWAETVCRLVGQKVIIPTPSP